eukprot:TRINITY_DN90864_c0_g1_i1.p1 TRINITY_DN90864_c0_g1~~TRINITY_DN90864_c0_g1_i1.p1  ORF type:complete len:599 (+),score=113.53 TRINITY_DN90864_c0_g1_i1:66-1862(+)
MLQEWTADGIASAFTPVVSVRRMPAKGCAIVLLRSRAVLELSVAMRVAVVDGVCVEVRKHSRKREGAGKSAADEPEGVFVAWGHRVARKVDISEKGLESYFNGLSAVHRPAQIEPVRPFAEQLQVFVLSSGGPMPLDISPRLEKAVAERMLEGVHGQPELVQELWKAKEQLEELWKKPAPPLGRSLMQRVARDQLFPYSGKEGEKHENRAGAKLEELSQATGLLEGVPARASFVDLCGGPGAWSHFLLSKPEFAMRGFGVTLRSGAGDADSWKAEEKDDWYPNLLDHPNWTALWGVDGTGDLLKVRNLNHTVSALQQHGGVFFCLADGGFSDRAIPPNLLELYFYRLLLAELLTAVSVLQPGGRFVCKLYTVCSDSTASLLFLTTRLFEKVTVLKPMTSRVAGPERYLYASGFHPGAETEAIRAALTRSHELGNGASPLQVPLISSLIVPANLLKDQLFVAQLQTMTSCLCRRQAEALRAIVQRADELEDMAMNIAEMAYRKDAKSAVAVAATAALSESATTDAKRAVTAFGTAALKVTSHSESTELAPALLSSLRGKDHNTCSQSWQSQPGRQSCRNSYFSSHNRGDHSKGSELRSF